MDCPRRFQTALSQEQRPSNQQVLAEVVAVEEVVVAVEELAVEELAAWERPERQPQQPQRQVLATILLVHFLPNLAFLFCTSEFVAEV